MKKILALLAVVMITASSMAQDGKMLRRIQIRHADPQLVYLLLRGQTTFSTPPELSTLRLFGNGGFGNSGFGGGNFGGFSGGGRSGGGFSGGFGG